MNGPTSKEAEYWALSDDAAGQQPRRSGWFAIRTSLE